MIDLFHDLTQWLEDKKLIYFLNEKKAISVRFSGINASFYCLILITEGKKPRVTFISNTGLKIPRSKMLEVSEFIMRADYPLGRFVLDYSLREVYFQTSITLQSQLTDDIIDGLLYSNICSHDFFFPGIIQVAFQKILAPEALKAVEDGLVKDQEKVLPPQEKVDAIVEKLLADIQDPLTEEIITDDPKPKKRTRQRKKPANDKEE